MADGIVAEVEYRELPQFPGYRFGSDGSIWTRKRQGKAPDSGTWRLRKQPISSHGYRVIELRTPGTAGRGKQFLSHALILEAFIGPCPPGMECAHDNGIRHDNRLTNIAWKTPSANWDDKRRHGTSCEGERHYRAKLTDAQVIEAVALRASGLAYRAIGNRFGVSAQCVFRYTRCQSRRSLLGPLLGAVK